MPLTTSAGRSNNTVTGNIMAVDGPSGGGAAQTMPQLQVTVEMEWDPTKVSLASAPLVMPDDVKVVG